ncbi:MAG TPA: hypothetical protein VFU88_21510 [Ktedonobacterales bacterium]|nr:hypothetical protein [Ktedonobacterales bacterium]
MAGGQVNEPGPEPGHQQDPTAAPTPGGQPGSAPDITPSNAELPKPSEKPSSQDGGWPGSQSEAAWRRMREWSAQVTAVLPTVRRGLPGRRMWWRWVAAGLLAVVLLAAGGAALYKLDHAPEDAAAQFCAAVTSGHYDQAYALLATPLRARFTRQALTQMGVALDRAEGRVTACGEAGNGAFDHRLGSGDATVTARITRAQGDAFSGHMRLVDDGGWKVVALDASLVGVSLGALDTVERVCAALAADDRAATYALAAESAGLGAQSDFTAKMDTWAQVDGRITGCALAGIARGPGANSETVAQVTLSVTRARRATQTATLGLALQPQGWRVTRIGADLLGSDLVPLALARQFCADLTAGAYDSAYGLFSSRYRAAVSGDQFTSSFAALGGTLTCAPKLETYHVAGNSGTLDVALSLAGAGGTVAATETLAFEREGADWRIDGATPRAG